MLFFSRFTCAFPFYQERGSVGVVGGGDSGEGCGGGGGGGVQFASSYRLVRARVCESVYARVYVRKKETFTVTVVSMALTSFYEYLRVNMRECVRNFLPTNLSWQKIPSSSSSSF